MEQKGTTQNQESAKDESSETILDIDKTFVEDRGKIQKAQAEAIAKANNRINARILSDTPHPASSGTVSALAQTQSTTEVAKERY
jgi:hypothetical protein